MQELSLETAELLPDREVMSSSCCKPRNCCEQKCYEPCEPTCTVTVRLCDISICATATV
jgi:hypothetical protein